jgi:hypothetical protein
MFTHQHQIHSLSQQIYELDQVCRKDFKNNFIVSERDYISIFLNFIRYPYGPFSNHCFAHSQTLPGSVEQKYGCDGIIIFKRDNRYKIGVFEAKVIKKRWDSLTGKAPGISRFQNQINKQAGLNPGIAVWEMFLNKDTSKAQFDTLGSTCVKKDIASAYKKTTPLWTYKDLEDLALKSCTFNNQVVNIESIIREILTCTFGDVFEYNAQGIELYSDAVAQEIKIPLIGGELSPEDPHKIKSFLQESNFYSYTHIDLNQCQAVERQIAISEVIE